MQAAVFCSCLTSTSQFLDFEDRIKSTPYTLPVPPASSHHVAPAYPEFFSQTQCWVNILEKHFCQQQVCRMRRSSGVDTNKWTRSPYWKTMWSRQSLPLAIVTVSVGTLGGGGWLPISNQECSLGSDNARIGCFWFRLHSMDNR